MSKVEAVSSARDMETLLFAAWDQVKTNPSEVNKQYLRELLESWKRQDWVISTVLAYLETLKQNTPPTGRLRGVWQNQFTLDFTAGIANGASQLETWTAESKVDVWGAEDNVYVSGLNYFIYATNPFNIDSEQGILIDATIGDIGSRASIFHSMIKTEPTKIGTDYNIIDTHYIPSMKGGPNATVGLKVYNYSGQEIKGTARLLYRAGED